jgi:probable phosphoglycerate mutase
MRIYLLRHADPDYERDTLTTAGHSEARALAQYLQTLQVSEIYASPLGRTQATASYTADLLNLPIFSEPWLREVDSDWVADLNRSCKRIDPEQNPLAMDIPGEGRLRRFQPDPRLLEKQMQPIRDGSDDFLCRQGFVRQGEVYRVRGENRKSIAVFTHMGVCLAWLSHLLELPLPVVWSGFFVHPASVTTLLMDERSPGYAIPRCTGLGDISHLCLAGSRPRPAGIFANAD